MTTLDTIKQDSLKTMTLYLKKRDNSLDMRFKSNQDWIILNKKPRWWVFLQTLANNTGAKSCGFGSSGVQWKIWFNPWYQLHRMAWKLSIYWPYKL